MARRFGERIPLTTGSKDLAALAGGTGGEKRCSPGCCRCRRWFSTVAIWGLASGRSSALCGPFSAEFNAAFYRQCRADVVVTKASGAEGGYQEKSTTLS